MTEIKGLNIVNGVLIGYTGIRKTPSILQGTTAIGTGAFGNCKPLPEDCEIIVGKKG